jgi:hypothetical protein
LEKIHDKSAVQANLKIKKGHRLKPEITGSESRKRKIRPSIDIHFTEVEGHPNANKIIDTTLDNDDLPSIEQLLSGGPISSTRTEIQELPRCDNPTPNKRSRLSQATQETSTSANAREHFEHMPLNTLDETMNHYAEAKMIPENGEFDELDEWLRSGVVEMD